MAYTPSLYIIFVATGNFCPSVNVDGYAGEDK